MKKNPEIFKEELLNLLNESDTVEVVQSNTQNIINQREAIDIVKRYEEIIKTETKNIRYEAMQGQMLKKLRRIY